MVMILINFLSLGIWQDYCSFIYSNIIIIIYYDCLVGGQRISFSFCNPVVFSGLGFDFSLTRSF